MYCYQCGVELAEGERKCPLCGTEVPVRPDREKEYTYPPGERISDEKVSRGGAVFVLSVVFLIPFVITLLCDVQINGTLTWGGYASGAIFVLYVTAVLPVWFRQPNPVIFLAADFIAARNLSGLYQLDDGRQLVLDLCPPCDLWVHGDCGDGHRPGAVCAAWVFVYLRRRGHRGRGLLYSD